MSGLSCFPCFLLKPAQMCRLLRTAYAWNATWQRLPVESAHCMTADGQVENWGFAHCHKIRWCPQSIFAGIGKHYSSQITNPLPDAHCGEERKQPYILSLLGVSNPKPNAKLGLFVSSSLWTMTQRNSFTKMTWGKALWNHLNINHKTDTNLL